MPRHQNQSTANDHYAKKNEANTSESCRGKCLAHKENGNDAGYQWVTCRVSNDGADIAPS